MTTKSKAGIAKPKHPICLSSITTMVDPSQTESTTVKATLQSPLWFQAMKEEYQALQALENLEPCSSPTRKTLYRM